MSWKKPLLRPEKETQIRVTRYARADRGIVMLRSMQLRFAAIALFAVSAVSLTTASARAFSQENGGGGGDANSTFADPDEQVNIFGYGAGAQPYGSNGSAQLGTKQDRLNAFKHFQSDGLTSPPDPLSRPHD
jgi:hypothetical protein